MLKKLAAALAALTLLSGCATRLSTHPVQPAATGVPTSTAAMLTALRRPGGATLDAVVAADWRFPHASATGPDQPWENSLLDGKIFFYAFRHPDHGLILIDAGMPDDAPRQMGPVLRRLMNIDQTYATRQSTAGYLAATGETPRAVFVTHLHFDHVLGVRDLPRDTPIHVGPGEGAQSNLVYGFVAHVTARALDGRPPLREWRFQPDPDGRLPGVIDVFGDGSLFAISAPGHTPGSTVYVVNAVDGVHLITGDLAHSRAAWLGERMDRAAFDPDLPTLRSSLAAMQAVAADIPGVIVHPGHQALEDAP